MVLAQKDTAKAPDQPQARLFNGAAAESVNPAAGLVCKAHIIQPLNQAGASALPLDKANEPAQGPDIPLGSSDRQYLLIQSASLHLSMTPVLGFDQHILAPPLNTPDVLSPHMGMAKSS